MDLRLRKVCQEDLELLFQWANDPVVRNNAFHTEQIPYEDHVRWFAKMMADESVYQYILCEGDIPVGQIRLNIEENTAVISYSVSAAYRGMGYGSRMLEMIFTQITQDKITSAIKIIGQVKYGNTASIRAFESCGYARRELPEYIEFTKLVKNG